jgi:hypothetical protein
MKATFESVVLGLNKYIDQEICSNLNDLQDFAARLVVGRLNDNADKLKQYLMSNGFVKTLCVIDSDGMVDVDRLFQDVKREIDRKGSLPVPIPLIGKITFHSADVDVLYNLIEKE